MQSVHIVRTEDGIHCILENKNRLGRHKGKPCNFTAISGKAKKHLECTVHQVLIILALMDQWKSKIYSVCTVNIIGKA